MGKPKKLVSTPLEGTALSSRKRGGAAKLLLCVKRIPQGGKEKSNLGEIHGNEGNLYTSVQNILKMETGPIAQKEKGKITASQKKNNTVTSSPKKMLFSGGIKRGI